LILGIVARNGQGARYELTAGDRLHPGEHFQQGALSRPVRPQKGDAVATLDHEINAMVNDLVPVNLADPSELHRSPTGAGRFGKDEVDIRLLDRGFQSFDLFQLLHAALGLPGAVLAHPVALDEPLDLADPVLLILEGCQLDLAPQGLFCQVLGVGAGVFLQLSLFEFEDARDHSVQEGAVVGNEDHRRRCAEEVVFQPQQGIQVEVVGRFVEQQQVRFGKEQPGQFQPHGPAAAEGCGRAVQLGRAKTEAGQYPAGAGFEVITAQVLEPFEKMGLTQGQRSASLRILLPVKGFMEGPQFGLNGLAIAMDVHD